MTTTQNTAIALVTDDTSASLEYGDYRGYVEIDANTGEWLRNMTHDERAELWLSGHLSDPIYSTEYADLRHRI